MTRGPQALAAAPGEEHWTSISDLMTGLMMIFLFVAVAYMYEVSQRQAAMQEVAVTYEALQNDLYTALLAEFRADLPLWNAEIDRASLSVSFKEPEVFFAPGSAAIRPRFMEILDDFFPRYVRVLRSNGFKAEIEEVRIEGHTSSEWSEDCDTVTSYFHNMELSQDRTRAVLEHVLRHPALAADEPWLISHVTANGLSFSRPRVCEGGGEDRKRSRRVEFRVRTQAERRIGLIIEQSRGGAVR